MVYIPSRRPAGPVTEPGQRDAATLVAAGPMADTRRLRRHVGDGWLVGVDGGAARLWEMGLLPHIVTGDFDSLSAGCRTVLAAAGSRVVPTPDQNFTDLDKALAYAVDILAA